MAKLNSKQRSWLVKFLEKYPYYELKDVIEDLGGDRVLTLVGWEQLPLPLIPEMEGALPGYHCHALKAKLRKFGDPRSTAQHSVTTTYPHCELEKKPLALKQQGQLSLSIHVAVLEVPEPINPVVVAWKPKRKVKPKLAMQLSLPVAGLEAELFRLRQLKQPYLPPISSQELLGKKVETWSLRDSRSVEVPQVLLDLLRSYNANEAESQNAIDLFEVTGISGAIM